MSEKFKYLHQDGDYPKVTDGESVWCFAFSIDGQTMCDLLNELFNKTEQLKKENEELKSELSETKEILHSIEKDRNQTLLICKKYEGFFKEKGYDIQDLIDYARDGSND